MATLAHHFEEGGWGMYPLVACSIAWLFLTLERAAVLFARRANVESLLRGLEISLRRGDVSEALATAGSARGPAGRVTHAALREALGSDARVEAAAAERLAFELPRLHRRIPLLSSVMSVATLFGLLGTTTGLFGYHGHSADAASRACMLARSISESLNCTAGGLLVAILAMASAEVAHRRAASLESELRLVAIAVQNLLVTHRARLRWNGQRAERDPVGYRDLEVFRDAA